MLDLGNVEAPTPEEGHIGLSHCNSVATANVKEVNFSHTYEHEESSPLIDGEKQ
jgi:hypothetical protein